MTTPTPAAWTLPRREAWLTALGILAIALLVRVAAAAIIGFPKPEDTAYYVGVARNLVEGRGLVSDALWSYHTPPLEFPAPERCYFTSEVAGSSTASTALMTNPSSEGCPWLGKN